MSEFVEAAHFDGISYPSAMNRAGTNIVLFDAAKCEIGASQLFKVTNVEVDYTNDLSRLSDDYPEPWP